MTILYSFEKQWEGDQDRPDWRQVVSDYILAPGGGGSITKSVSSTVTWGITIDLGISFEHLNASVGGNYSEARTFGEDYRFDLLAGEKARIIFIPKMRFMNGWLTIKEITRPHGPHTPTQTEVILDQEWTQIHFPIDGGYFTLEHDVPTFYTDSQYQGQVHRLNKGDYDWGSIPNDVISSVRVPLGYTVKLFKDTKFQGESQEFKTGDYPYVGDNFNDQVSSIQVW